MGYVRDLLIARYLGAGIISDSFFVAFKLPNLFRRLFAEGAMNSAFIPVISGIQIKDGKRKAVEFLSESISLIFLFLLVLVITFELFMPTIISLIAPGFVEDKEKFELAVKFSRLTFPFLVFISVSSLIGGYLNTMRKFAAMAFTPVILNISMISALLFFELDQSNKVLNTQYLSLSISLAGVLQLIWLLFYLRKIGIFLEFKKIFSKTLFKISRESKKLFKLFLPAAIGNGVYQINLLIDMILASTLPAGSISYLFFSDRVNQLPLGVLGIALSTALLPILSEQIKKNNLKDANASINNCLQLSFLFAIPASLGLIGLSNEIINFLFVRGEFTSESAKLTSLSLCALSFGLPAFILIKVLAVCFFSREDTKTPVYVALITMIINLILNLILIDYFLHVGLAIATSISAWLNAIILLVILKKRKLITIDNKTVQIFFKSIFSSIVMFFIINYSSNLVQFNYFLAESFIEKLVILSLLIIIGIFIYSILMYFFKASNLLDLKKEKDNSK